MAMIDYALGIAVEAHANQLDKQHKPYILHVIAVVNSFKIESLQVVAALHDVVEDTSVTLADLRQFPYYIVDAVDAITKRKGEALDDYYTRVKANPIALKVKLVDVIHNLSRIDELKNTPDYERLLNKYQHAMNVLTDSAPQVV